MPLDMQQGTKSFLHGAHMMACKKDDCVIKSGRVLHKLVDLKQVNERECDTIRGGRGGDNQQ